jgi:endoglucanase
MYWCNPSGRALGVQPTTATGNGHIDAFLWVKRPGDSDGSCGQGDPGPGHFVNQFAIDLARNAGH